MDNSVTSQGAILEYDFDKENQNDITAVSLYATDIFNYYKYREVGAIDTVHVDSAISIPALFQRFFKVGNYLPRQSNMNTEVRARIVDWLVEMQETFELNHETLYLGVKLFDMYLDRVDRIDADKLQLIGSAAMFIASKFDVRSLPSLI